MTTARLDPEMPLPPGLDHEAAERAARRVAALAIIDQRRRDPLRLSAPIPVSLQVSYRGGLRHDGRPTCAWRFGFVSVDGLAEATYHLIGVSGAGGQAYYSAYPAMLTLDETDSIIGDWIAADAQAYAERERILAVYRARLEEAPEQASRHYELALIGTTLATCFVTVSDVDALFYPGPLDEFAPAALEACARMPCRASWLALAAFLHERLTRFDEAARLYGEAVAAEPRSAVYASLHADALLFAGDVVGAARAARDAEQRARARRARFEFGLGRGTVLDRFKETLQEEALAVRKNVEGLQDAEASEEARAEEHRRAIRIDPERVPAAFRDLIPLARRWGVGDDGARGFLTGRATAMDRARLKKALPWRRRGAVQAWLDSLGPEGITSDEAGAFMFLLEAVEELGL
ncbi:MAG: hypothetical protein KJ025_21000 [Burkholderiales bacterium]|nr:hypothetical protein [Burkholderiales bacterium]